MRMAASFRSRDIFLYGIVQETMRNEVESRLKAYKSANPNLGFLYVPFVTRSR